jgi:hypothetical protein
MNANMNEDAIRSLVRDVIGRIESRGQGAVSDAPRLIQLGPHPSNYEYALQPSDGPCFIEPGVRCNHCGYCQTHGH